MKLTTLNISVHVKLSCRIVSYLTRAPLCRKLVGLGARKKTRRAHGRDIPCRTFRGHL